MMKSQKLIVLEMLRKGVVTRFNAYEKGVLNITARIADLFGRWHLIREASQ